VRPVILALLLGCAACGDTPTAPTVRPETTVDLPAIIHLPNGYVGRCGITGRCTGETRPA